MIPEAAVRQNRVSAARREGEHCVSGEAAKHAARVDGPGSGPVLSPLSAAVVAVFPNDAASGVHVRSQNMLESLSSGHLNLMNASGPCTQAARTPQRGWTRMRT